MVKLQFLRVYGTDITELKSVHECENIWKAIESIPSYWKSKVFIHSLNVWFPIFSCQRSGFIVITIQPSIFYHPCLPSTYVLQIPSLCLRRLHLASTDRIGSDTNLYCVHVNIPELSLLHYIQTSGHFFITYDPISWSNAFTTATLLRRFLPVTQYSIP